MSKKFGEKSTDKFKHQLEMDRMTNTDKASFNFKKYDDISEDKASKDISIYSLIPAPKDWNFYTPYSDDKMNEMVFSIRDNGLHYPIIVWEQLDSRYMILAGHNRYKAYMLLESTDAEKYAKIPAIVYAHNAIDEEFAKQLIIDTNWVQRELNIMEKTRSITFKYEILAKDDYTGTKEHKRNIIAKDLGISGRQVSKYYAITRLVEPLKKMVYDSKIGLSYTSTLASFDDDTQNWLYDSFKGRLNNKNLSNLKSNMERNELEEVFAIKPIRQAHIKIKVPKEKEAELRRHINEWLLDHELTTI